MNWWEMLVALIYLVGIVATAATLSPLYRKSNALSTWLILFLATALWPIVLVALLLSGITSPFSNGKGE